MAESILDSVKKVLGVSVDDTDFDGELMIYINSVLSNLTQLGVGPTEGFAITGRDEKWDVFLPEPLKMNNAITYVSFSAKLMFDPPPTSFAIDAMKEQIKEAGWRLNVTREETDWVDPDPQPVPEPDPMLF